VDNQGYIDMYTKFGEGNQKYKTLKVWYMIVDASTLYNILFQRSSLNKLEVVSTPHFTMNFPSEHDNIVSLHMNKKMAWECYVTSLRLVLPTTPTP